MEYTAKKFLTDLAPLLLLVSAGTAEANTGDAAGAAAPNPTTGGAIVKTYNHGVPWEEAYHTTQAYEVNGTIYISGQFSHDMSGKFVGEGNFKEQAQQTFRNIDRVLASFGLNKSNIAEMEVYLTNPKDQFEQFAMFYRDYVGDHRSAATVIGVTGLAFPQELIEIRVVAHVR